MKKVDLFVIGAGPGGYNCAIRAARNGLHVALAEKEKAGGTCLNRGCVPTKALLHASQAWHELDKFERFGLSVENPAFDIDAIYGRMAEVVSQQRSGLLGLFEANGIEYVEGSATIQHDGVVSVNGEEFQAKDIVIATGSVPARPPIKGADLAGVITSDDVLQATNELPDSRVIIGGGVIGVELAGFWSDLGAQVTILEAQDHLLPLLDNQVGDHLQTLFKRRSIKVQTGAQVTEIREGDSGLEVLYLSKGKEKSVSAEKVLVATGRWPLTEDLLAEDLTLQMNGRFIQVDENFQTSQEHIYAIGDVIGGAQLAHKAEAEGQFLANHLACKPDYTDVKVIPSAVYTRPEIASVGYSEEELQAENIPYKKGLNLTLANARSQIESSDRGFVKILVEEESNRLLGAHLICERASDLIAVFTPFVSQKADYHELLRGVYPHPSFSELLREALESIEMGAIHQLP